MALELSLSAPLQSNDQTTLRLTDDTGVYDAANNATGWGAPNTNLSDIDGSTTTLTITITITTSAGTSTTYDAIDAYTYIGGSPSTVNDLVFDVTPAILQESGTPLGAADDTLPDGWYDIDYTVSYNLAGGAGTSDTYEVSIFIDGVVRTCVYDELRQLPTYYNCEEINLSHDDFIKYYNPIYNYSLFQSMIANLSTSNKEKVLNILATLEDRCVEE